MKMANQKKRTNMTNYVSVFLFTASGPLCLACTLSDHPSQCTRTVRCEEDEVGQTRCHVTLEHVLIYIL